MDLYTLLLKTSFNTTNITQIALAVRRPYEVTTGNHWEDLHSVQVRTTDSPSRPIALLDELNNQIYVTLYTDRRMG